MSLEVPEGTPDRRQGILIVTVLVLVLTSLATSVRATSKFVTAQYWWWDDLFAILAYLCNIPFLTLTLYWRAIGLGLPIQTVLSINPQHAITGAHYLFIDTILFDAILTFPKLSAILFYARVLRTTSRLFRAHLCLASLLASSWLLVTWILTFLRCRPLQRTWNPTIPGGTCSAQYPRYLSTAIISTLIDMYILILPVPSIWSLRIPPRRRIYLLATFFLAYSVIVVSLGRLAATVTTTASLAEDLTWNFATYLYWAELEACVSIVSINVPAGIALVKALVGTGRRRGWKSRRVFGSSGCSPAAHANGNGRLDFAGAGAAQETIGGTPIRGVWRPRPVHNDNSVEMLVRPAAPERSGDLGPEVSHGFGDVASYQLMPTTTLTSLPGDVRGQGLGHSRQYLGRL